MDWMKPTLGRTDTKRTPEGCRLAVADSSIEQGHVVMFQLGLPGKGTMLQTPNVADSKPADYS